MILDDGQSWSPGDEDGGVTGVFAPVVVVGQLFAPVIVVKLLPLCSTIELRTELLLKKSWRVTAGPSSVSPNVHTLSPLPSATTWVASPPLHAPQSAVVVGSGCGLPVDPTRLLFCHVVVRASVLRFGTGHGSSSGATNVHSICPAPEEPFSA